MKKLISTSSSLSKPVAVLDVDDVMLNFVGKSLEIASEIKGKNIKPVISEWNLDKRYGLNDEQHKLLWEKIQDSWGNLEPVDGASHLLENLLKRDYQIHFVTAIDNKFCEIRKNNLKRAFGSLIDFKKQKIHCVGLEGSKTAILKSIKPSIIVDDRLKNIADVHQTIQKHMFYLDKGVRENCYNKNINLLSKSKKAKFHIIHNVVDVFNYI